MEVVPSEDSGVSRIAQGVLWLCPCRVVVCRFSSAHECSCHLLVVITCLLLSPAGDNAPRPDSVIAIPIARRPLFPGFMIPITIHDQDTIDALVSLRRGLRPYVGCFMAKETPDGDTNEPDLFPLTSLDGVHEVGTLAHISHIVPLPGGVQAMFMAHRRISITGEVEGSSPLEATVLHHDPPPIGDHSDIVKAYSNEILTTLREVIKINPMFKEHVQYFTQRLDVQDVHKLVRVCVCVCMLICVRACVEQQRWHRCMPRHSRVYRCCCVAG